MTIAIDDFYRLKSQVEKLRQARDRAAGALEETVARLKAEFGCDTVEEGEALLASLRAKEASLLKKYLAAKAAFEADHADKLKGD